MKRRTTLLAAIFGIVVLTSGIALSAVDFGLMRDQLLTSKTQSLFGINADVAASSTTSADLTAAAADASRLVTVAKGLNVSVVTQGVAAPTIDMIALWPNDSALSE